MREVVSPYDSRVGEIALAWIIVRVSIDRDPARGVADVHIRRPHARKWVGRLANIFDVGRDLEVLSDADGRDRISGHVLCPDAKGRYRGALRDRISKS